MEWETFVYRHVDDCENTWFYQPTGYHPTRIGDYYQGRYRIVHKLGHGGSSTTWLARDEHTSTFVAVKICLAGMDHGHEIDALSRIDGPSFARQSDGSSLFPTVLDNFNIQGPNGHHSCLVTPAARCSLSDCRAASYDSIFRLPVARALAAQLAVAVAWMHEQGHVHGDLHLGNVLLHLPSKIDHLSDEQLYAEYGAPHLEELERMDEKPIPQNAPFNIVWEIWLGKRCKDLMLSEAKIILIDFGAAFRPSNQVAAESLTPLHVRAPEDYFEPATGISFASDIWTLACAIFEILGLTSLFCGMMATEDELISEYINTLGPPPADWWEKWSARSKFFSNDGKPLGRHAEPTLVEHFEGNVQEARRLEGMDALDKEEADDFLTMIRWMLSFKPGDRPSAKEVLQTKWMQKWALPEAAALLPSLDSIIDRRVMEHPQSLSVPVTLRTVKKTKAINEIAALQMVYSH